MKTLVTVMSHAEAQPTFNRHLRFWEAHKSDILVMCPQDAVVRTHLPVIAIGTKGHHSAGANRRFKELICVLNETRYDRFVILEYDAIIFQPGIPLLAMDGIWSNLFTDDSTQFQGHHFLHPPLIFNKEVGLRIHEELLKLPDDSESGFWDRYLGLACERGGIKMYGYEERGFSKNTIEPNQLAAAVEARQKGAMFYHGIKTQQVLEALVNAV